MKRKREQATIFKQLGALFGPVVKIAENPESYDSDERTRIHARFCFDTEAFKRNVQNYGLGEPGHDYGVQWHKIHSLVNSYKDIDHSIGIELYCKATKDTYQACFDALFSIPVPIESAIHEADTPFSTYCLVNDLCSTAAKRIIWMDRYFDATLFGLYFAEVPRSAIITLVTYPFSQCKGPRDEQRYNSFMSVSKLFAQERGASRYRLLTDEQFHDRWFECDNKMIVFGNSIKELGNDTTFTVSKLDGTADNQRHFDDAVARATEIFGPSQTTHP